MPNPEEAGAARVRFEADDIKVGRHLLKYRKSGSPALDYKVIGTSENKVTLKDTSGCRKYKVMERATLVDSAWWELAPD